MTDWKETIGFNGDPKIVWDEVHRPYVSSAMDVWLHHDWGTVSFLGDYEYLPKNWVFV